MVGVFATHTQQTAAGRLGRQVSTVSTVREAYVAQMEEVLASSCKRAVRTV